MVSDFVTLVASSSSSTTKTKPTSNIFWLICEFLCTQDIAYSLSYTCKTVYKGLKGFPLNLLTFDGEETTFLDQGWFEANAYRFSERWSVKKFAFVLEKLDSVETLINMFWKLDSSRLQPKFREKKTNLINCNILESVEEVCLDDLRSEKFRKSQERLSLPSHFTGLKLFSSLRKLSLKNVPFFAYNADAETSEMLGKLEYLSVWLCTIEGLSDVLEGCVSLKELKLGYLENADLTLISKCTSLTSLTISSSCDMVSLNGIKALDKLEKLNLSWCTVLVDITELSSCQKLAKLAIDHCDELTNLVPLTSLATLRSLSLVNVGIEDASFLYFLPSISELDVNFCPLEDMDDTSPLKIDLVSPFRRLDTLKLSWISRSLFRGLDMVTTCVLYECGALASLESLSDMKNLRNLTLRRCDELVTLDGIEKCTSLRKLFLAACFKIEDIYCLNQCPKLSDISFRRLVVPQLSNFPLEENNIIRRVSYIFCSELQSIDFLSKLVALEYLHMDNCTSLQDLSPIGKHATLRTLHVRGMSQPKLPVDWPVISPKLDSLKVQVCGTVERFIFDGSMPLLLRNFEISQCYAFADFSFLKEAEELERVTVIRCYEKLDEILEEKLLSKGVYVKRVNISSKIKEQVSRQLKNLERLSRRDIDQVEHLV